MASIPKDTWHGLKNNGIDYVHMFFVYSPAGFEDYVNLQYSWDVCDLENKQLVS